MNYRPLALLGLAALALAGCVKQEETANTPPASNTPAANAPAGNEPAGNAPATPVKTKGANERLKIAVVPKGTTHQFWQTIHAGADAAGKELNADILWNGPKRETDIQDQIDIINGFASQGIDGIALAATDKTSLVKTVQDLQSKGIAVVTIDSGIEPDVSSSFIATDNVEAAKKAAQETSRLVGGKGKVAVLSFLKGAGTSDQREQGFLEGIKQSPGIQVIGVEYTDSDSSKAADKMQTLLTANPDLVAVFASNEPNVVGAAKVLKDKKLVGKVKLIGFDASDTEISYMKDGVCQALVVQDPYKMGYEGVKAVAQMVRGQGTPPRRIDTGATVVTPQNINQPDVQKLLYPLGKK